MYEKQALAVALLLLLGYFGGQAAQRFKIPGIPGYIFAGVLMGPYVLNIVSPEMGEALGVFKVLGISVIALIVGVEIKFETLKALGKGVLIISTSQVFTVFIVVFLCFYYLVQLTLPVSLLLGAIATTTAPCVVVVIKELRANGALTSTLIEVVAFTDTFAIILFGVVSAYITNLLQGSSIVLSTVLSPMLFEVGFSFGVGGLTGLIFTLILKGKRPASHILALILSLVLLNSSLAYIFQFSPLLTNMMSGFILANVLPNPSRIFNIIDEIELPVFIVFFALAGATLSLTALVNSWVLVLVYIVTRTIGLLTGTFTGTFLARTDPSVGRYLWSSTLTKGALGIGLAMMVQQQFPEFASTITAVELSAVAIFETVGPICCKYSLSAAGETSDTA